MRAVKPTEVPADIGQINNLKEMFKKNPVELQENLKEFYRINKDKVLDDMAAEINQLGGFHLTKFGKSYDQTLSTA